jgi:transposase
MRWRSGRISWTITASAQYASVRRFVATLRAPVTKEPHVVITTPPGEEGQVDYGEGPMVRETPGGKYRRTRLFLLTLGCSRKSVPLLTWRSSAQIWCELHEQAFRRLGGTVRVIVLDNLKEGVLTPDVYDATLNPLYRDVLAHYGVVALPCRVLDALAYYYMERYFYYAYYWDQSDPHWLAKRNNAWRWSVGSQALSERRLV